MPEEIEIETNELQETIEEMREERLERKEDEKRSGWLKYISLTTAMLAVVAAVGALYSGSLVNEALLEKNKAVLLQAQASDKWTYYQAKGLKSNGASQTADLLAANPSQATAAEKWRGEAARYKSDQESIKKEAEELEKQRDEKGVEAEHFMHHHHLFAYCVTFTQVAIALSAVAALTKRKPVWYFSMLAGVFGLGYFIYGFLAITPPPEKPEASIEKKVVVAKPSPTKEGKPGKPKAE